MKIHEYQARELFQKVGIPTPSGCLALELNEAQKIIQEIGFPAVLKSQVLVGGRGKAGGIRVVQNNLELDKNFSELKNLNVKGYRVEKILVVKALEIRKEYYLAVTVDYARGDVVVIASSEGGVDIEETAQKGPEKIQKLYLEGRKDISQTKATDFLKKVFQDSAALEEAEKIFHSLLTLFFQYDCVLAEVNPLIIDVQGNWYALDSKVIFDDNALIRHPEILTLRDLRHEDPDETQAKEHDLSFVKLDGDIGCIVNGAGLAMATTDVIKMSGGEPANFLDVGGSSNPEKVLNALKIILRNSQVKAILINIFGGITRCDDIAKGILEAKKELDIRVPLAVRLTGTNEKEAIALLSKEKMNIYSSMREAVGAVVKLAKV